MLKFIVSFTYKEGMRMRNTCKIVFVVLTSATEKRMDYRRPCTVATMDPKLYTVKCKKHAKHLRLKIVLLNQCLVLNFSKTNFPRA
jgi:hypothetical protein